MTFKELTEKMNKIYEAKNSDYGNNFYSSERLGIKSWVGTLIRIQDKVARLENFAKKGTLKVDNEKVEDTLLDLSCYSLLCLIEYEKNIHKICSKG